MADRDIPRWIARKRAYEAAVFGEQEEGDYETCPCHKCLRGCTAPYFQCDLKREGAIGGEYLWWTIFGHKYEEVMEQRVAEYKQMQKEEV